MAREARRNVPLGGSTSPDDVSLSEWCGSVSGPTRKNGQSEERK
jgi:hypothetical protein